MKNLTVKNMKTFNNVKYKQMNKQQQHPPTPHPPKANSVFFSLLWNKRMVQSQYSCCFFELLQTALDFNDFGEMKGGEIITLPNSPFLSLTGD